MSYRNPHRRRRGGLGLGEATDAPVKVGEAAKVDPILSTASVIASALMLKMAAVPRPERLPLMVSSLNNWQHGAGDAAKAAFLARVAKDPDAKDQAIFDAMRMTIAEVFVKKLLAQRAGAAGLGQISQGVRDANSLFCSYGAGTMAMVGGALDATGVTRTQGAWGAGAMQGATIAGCDVPRLQAQADIAERQARLAQSSTFQTLAMQQAQEARMFRYVLVGGALVSTAIIGYAVMKK